MGYDDDNLTPIPYGLGVSFFMVYVTLVGLSKDKCVSYLWVISQKEKE